MTTASSLFLSLHADDDVQVARRRAPAGSRLNGVDIVSTEPVEMGHKVARRAIPAGAPVRKYGQVIGFATTAIAPGEWVHVHNVGLGDLKLTHA